MKICKTFIFAALDIPLKDHTHQIGITNAFTGCTKRVINFKGFNIDFQVAKQPIILLRYSSQCKTYNIFPYELGPAYSILRSQNVSHCLNTKTNRAKLPPEQIGNKYVSQFLSESFQLQSRNKPCEANVYFHPPSELESPQMHNNTQYWENHLRNPFACHHIIIHEHRKLMRKQVDTVPLMSNFICKSTADSICGNERNGKKWIAGVFVERKLFDRICNKVVIWKVESFSLETLCVYCDSCDSFKTILLQTKLIPTSGNELERVLKEIEEKSREPHSIRVVLYKYMSLSMWV